MSVQVAPYRPVASYQTRVRTSVVGVLIAWSLAALFLVLGWKHRPAAQADEHRGAPVVMRAG